MSKNTKIFIASIAIILAIGLYLVGKTSFAIFNKLGNLETTSKSYTLLENKILLKDKNNIEKMMVFNDSTEYVIHFWATWCKPCISEFDSIEKYHKSWKNVELVMVTLENTEKMNSFLKDKKWDLPFYTTDSLQLPFNPKTIKYYPSTFAVKNDSLEVAIGPIEWNQAYK